MNIKSRALEALRVSGVTIFNADAPPYTMRLVSTPVEAKVRKLRANWGLDKNGFLTRLPKVASA